MRVLVSGFEPFLEEKINPTEQIVNFVNSCVEKSSGLEPSGWSSLEVRGVILPVLFNESFARLEKERSQFKPDVILSFGLAGGRSTIDIEQIAVNFRGTDTGQTDNSGSVVYGPIDSSLPLSLPTTLPSEQLVASLRAVSIPVRASFTAGTYVCNDLFFQMQNCLRYTRVRSGFIHVPRLDENDWKWPRFQTAVEVILTSFADEIESSRTR